MDVVPLLLSLTVALTATGLAALLGLPIAALLAYRRFPGSDLVDVLVTAPRVVPPTVLGYYLLVILGHDSRIGGAFESLTGTPIVFTRTGAVVAATIGALPLIIKAARAAFESVDVRLLAVASTLGASGPRRFFKVALPLARPGIVAGLALGFARAAGDFGVTLMVAGDIPGVTRTGALSVYNAVAAGRDADAASTAGALTVVCGALLYLAARLGRGGRPT